MDLRSRDDSQNKPTLNSYIAATAFLAILYLASLFPLLFVARTISDTVVVGFFVLVSASGILFNRKITLAAIALSALTLCGVYWLESSGYLTSPRGSATLNDLLLILFGLSMNTILVLAHNPRPSPRDIQRTYTLARANQQLATEVEERQQSELRTRILAESSSDFICIWDVASQSWSYSNRPHFLGHSSQDLQEPTFFLEHVHPEDRPFIKERWMNFDDGAQEQQLEFRLRNAKGDWDWLEVRARVLSTDHSGKPAEIVIAFTVITLRKHYEDTLQLAQETAEAATRAKSEFLANMSHEIRTPMNSVIGMTSLLEATELNEDQRAYLNTIRHSSDALLTILNDILDLSKSEAGRLGIEREPVDIYRSVEEVIDLLAPKAAEKNLELAYRIGRTVPSMVMADSARLRQILINIISNAIKFTSQGEVSVLVEANALPEEQVEIVFSVRDTGIGIAPDHIEQLFQPFSQADASNTRDYGGAGLGLVLSKRLCELMGGRIWVESELYAGSTFHFTIVAPVLPTTGNMTVHDRHPLLDGRSVLIVDDNPAAREVITQMVEDWGMNATTAASGAEALALVHQQIRFDVVLIDMQLPGMAGLTLAKELRKQAADLPVIMTSSLGIPMYVTADHRNLHDLPVVVSPAAGAQQEAVRQLGVKGVVFKPIKPGHLRAALLEQFDIARPADEAHETHEFIDPEMGINHPLRILIAEDNVVNQKVVLRMLQRLGYSADVVVNGLVAVNALHRQHYDVILMDVQMPELDGLEATRRLRRELAHDEQPYIIAMTAAVMEIDRTDCLRAGMDDFLAKPTRLEDLAQALKNYARISTGTS